MSDEDSMKASRSDASRHTKNAARRSGWIDRPVSDPRPVPSRRHNTNPGTRDNGHRSQPSLLKDRTAPGAPERSWIRWKLATGAIWTMLSSMEHVAPILATVVMGYLTGSLPLASWWARRRGAIDLRAVGDRNPGYWNARIHLGVRSSVVVFIGDVAKGSLAAGLGWWLCVDFEPRWSGALIGGGAAMVGHAWPIWARFRGGRSILTFVGTMLVADPITSAVAILLTLLVRLTTRRFDLAARVGVFGFPVIQILIAGPWRTAATGVLMSLIGLRFAQAARSARAVPATDDPAR